MQNQDQIQTIVFVEWEHTQAVIARKSEARLKFRGWLYTLLSALSIAVFSNKLVLSHWRFLILAFSIVFLFGLKEYIIHMEHQRAISRSEKLEAYLRDEREIIIPYLTNEMTNEMTNIFTKEEIINAIKDSTFFIQYLLISVTAIILAVLAPIVN